jgi:hypothetical protein
MPLKNAPIPTTLVLKKEILASALACRRRRAVKAPTKAATSVTTDSDSSKPANEVISGFLPEVTLPERVARAHPEPVKN